MAKKKQISERNLEEVLEQMDEDSTWLAEFFEHRGFQGQADKADHIGSLIMELLDELGSLEEAA